MKLKQTHAHTQTQMRFVHLIMWRNSQRNSIKRNIIFDGECNPSLRQQRSIRTAALMSLCLSGNMLINQRQKQVKRTCLPKTDAEVMRKRYFEWCSCYRCMGFWFCFCQQNFSRACHWQQKQKLNPVRWRQKHNMKWLACKWGLYTMWSTHFLPTRPKHVFAYVHINSYRQYAENWTITDMTHTKLKRLDESRQYYVQFNWSKFRCCQTVIEMLKKKITKSYSLDGARLFMIVVKPYDVKPSQHSIYWVK